MRSDCLVFGTASVLQQRWLFKCGSVQKSCFDGVRLSSVFTEVIWVKCPPRIPVFQQLSLFRTRFLWDEPEALLRRPQHSRFAVFDPARGSGWTYLFGGIPYHFTAYCYLDIQTVGFVVWMQ